MASVSKPILLWMCYPWWSIKNCTKKQPYFRLLGDVHSETLLQTQEWTRETPKATMCGQLRSSLPSKIILHRKSRSKRQNSIDDLKGHRRLQILQIGIEGIKCRLPNQVEANGKNRILSRCCTCKSLSTNSSTFYLQWLTLFRRLASLTLKNSSPDCGCLLSHSPECKRTRSCSSCWCDWHPLFCPTPPPHRWTTTPGSALEVAMDLKHYTTAEVTNNNQQLPSISLLSTPLFKSFLSSQPNRAP